MVRGRETIEKGKKIWGVICVIWRDRGTVEGERESSLGGCVAEELERGT